MSKTNKTSHRGTTLGSACVGIMSSLMSPIQYSQTFILRHRIRTCQIHRRESLKKSAGSLEMSSGTASRLGRACSSLDVKKKCTGFIDDDQSQEDKNHTDNPQENFSRCEKFMALIKQSGKGCDQHEIGGV